MGAIVEFDDGTHSFIATGITTTKSSAGDVVANQWYDSLAKFGVENLQKIRGILSDRAKSQAGIHGPPADPFDLGCKFRIAYMNNTLSKMIVYFLVNIVRY